MKLLIEVRKRVALFLLRGIDIDFSKKCEYCFSEWKWQTKDRKFVCEKHHHKICESIRRGEK